MEMDQRDLDTLKVELDKLSRNVSSIGDSVKIGVRDGMKEANADLVKQKSKTDDSSIAEKANTRLIMRHKEDYDASKEMYKSKEKSPEAIAQERLLSSQLNMSVYMDQLLKVTKENNEYTRKFNSLDNKNNNKGFNLFNTPSQFASELSKNANSTNPFSKLIGSTAELGLVGRDLFGGVFSGSNKRNKQIKKNTSEINREKSILSAEEARLEKLKKVRGKNRDKDGIKELEDSIKNRKNTIKTKSGALANTTADEYLYQKGKSDKNFKFKGTDRDLIKEQLVDNMTYESTKDIFNKGKPNIGAGKPKSGMDSGKSIDSSLDKLEKILKNVIDASNTQGNKNNTNSGNRGNSDNRRKYNNRKSYKNNRKNNRKDDVRDPYNELLGNPSNNRKSYKNNRKNNRKDDVRDPYNELLGNPPSKDDKSSTQLNVFDIKLKEASNPSTSGEYIVGIYKEIKKKTEAPTSMSKAPSGDDDGGGMGLFNILSKLGPMLASLGPMLAGAASAIGAVAAPLAIALGGAYAIKKTSDMMDESNQGTTLSDLVVGGGKGLKAFLKGDSFVDAFTEHQTERAGNNAKRDEDANLIKSSGDRFDTTVRPKFNRDYVTSDQLDELKQLYIDKVTHKIPANEYERARNSLMQQAKDNEQESATLKDSFTNIKASKSKYTNQQQQSTQSDAGSSGSAQRGSSKEVVETKSSTQSMSQYSGMDQMTAMTIQAKLIAMEMLNMNNNSDYINKQKDIMKTAGIAMADKLYGE